MDREAKNRELLKNEHCFNEKAKAGNGRRVFGVHKQCKENDLPQTKREKYSEEEHGASRLSIAELVSLLLFRQAKTLAKNAVALLATDMSKHRLTCITENDSKLCQGNNCWKRTCFLRLVFTNMYGASDAPVQPAAGSIFRGIIRHHTAMRNV